MVYVVEKHDHSVKAFVRASSIQKAHTFAKTIFPDGSYSTRPPHLFEVWAADKILDAG